MELTDSSRRRFLKTVVIGTSSALTSGVANAHHSKRRTGALASQTTIASGPPKSEIGILSTDQPDESEWQTVSFNKSYSNPVVVMNPPTANGSHPCHVRLRNITGSTFEFQIEEWRYLDGAHVSETISYVTLESGAHTTADGTHIEAGTVSTDETFANVSFSQSFAAQPIVLTQTQTYNGKQPVVTRQRNVSASGTEVRVQEEEALGDHFTETIGYVAAETGSTVIDGTEFEFGRTPDEVTGSWYKFDFQRNQVLPRFFADMQTFDGPNSAGLRYRNLSNNGVEVRVEEEQSKDTETRHNSEVVGYAVADPVPPIGETGSRTTNQPDASTWQTVNLEQSYRNPVVIMKPPSANGPHPCHVRVRNVKSSSFEFKIEEWDYLDGNHTTETIDYLVGESGAGTSPNGDQVEVGTVAADENFTNVDFARSFFEQPVVLTQPQTYNGGDPIVSRQRNVSTGGTEVRVQEEEANGNHVAETVGYVALEPGVRELFGIRIEVGRTPDVITDGWYSLDFERSCETPQFLADLQTIDGRDPAELRYRNLSDSGVEVRIEEEQSKDTETAHTTESVGYLVLGSEEAF